MTHDDGGGQIRAASDDDDDVVDLLVIGGGMSGLAAAIVAADATASAMPGANASIVLLEVSDGLGGRVRTDATADGCALDRGFAVFVKEYPASRRLLDYDGLGLGRFDPGARVRLLGRRRSGDEAQPANYRRDRGGVGCANVHGLGLSRPK